MTGIKIYKASAGSGKTFQITEEFLSIVLSNPIQFKNLLAVTFTNKAAEEMKSRILKELFILSSGEASNHLKKLLYKTGLDERVLIKNAEQALKLILFNYSSFSVSTIDKFFQRIIRAFAWELRIQQNLNIELEEGQILNEAIDWMYADLEKNETLKQWLLTFSQDQIKSGKAWNLKYQISRLGMEIYKESYQNLKEEKDGPKSKKPEEILKQLKLVIEEIESNLEDKKIQGLQVIANEGLTLDDFPFKASGLIGIFKKIENKNYELTNRMRAACADEKNWYTKSQTKEIRDKIEGLLSSGFFFFYCKLVEEIDQHLVDYYTAKEILKNFYTLGILNDLNKAIKALSKEKEIFLISGTNRLLKKIIDNSETPFIYEKTGSRFHHLMIDEFQDTSVLQWENFKPLIRNMLAENNRVILVGDIKQSIYRWRNGDWKILAHQVKEDFSAFGYSDENLNMNWRSKENLILFNSSLFPKAAEILEQILTEHGAPSMELSICNAYADAKQLLPQEHANEEKGFVKISFINPDSPEHFDNYSNNQTPIPAPGNEENIDQETMNRLALNKMTEAIIHLQIHGFRAGDIAILTRTTAESKLVAQHLLSVKKSPEAKSYQFDILSENALELASSETVKFIIHSLHNFKDPKNLLHRLNMLSFLNTISDKPMSENIDELNNVEFLTSIMNSSLISLWERLNQLNALQAIDTVIDFFKLEINSQEAAYLDTFRDWIIESSNPYSLSVADLLIRWEEKGKSKKIVLPAGSNAIQLLTIHKSKGMEFEAVIIPFCNWSIDNPANPPTILWTNTRVVPFNQIPLIPIAYSDKLKATHFTKQYYDEKLQAFVDSLNILYVAFTRAKSALIAIAPDHQEIDKLKTVNQLLKKIFSLNTISNDEINFPQFFSHTKHELIIGHLHQPTQKEKTNNSIDEIKFTIAQKKIKLGFKNSLESEEQEQEKTSSKEKGKIYHEILSRVIVPEDLDFSLQKALDEGKISLSEHAHLNSLLSKQLAQPAISKWFSPRAKIKTEKAIISKDLLIRIPDRIILGTDHCEIVDFKFGFMQKAIHQQQVKEYKDLLKSMGYSDVSTHIWYVELEKIITESIV